MAKAKGTRKAKATDTTATDSPVAVEVTAPDADATRDARAARRAPNGKVTAAQRTFLMNRGHDLGTAALAAGLTATDALAAVMAPESLDPSTLATLAQGASRAKVMRGGRSDYYTTRGYVTLAWNSGAPAMDKDAARDLTAAGIALSMGADVTDNT